MRFQQRFHLPDRIHAAAPPQRDCIRRCVLGDLVQRRCERRIQFMHTRADRRAELFPARDRGDLLPEHLQPLVHPARIGEAARNRTFRLRAHDHQAARKGFPAGLLKKCHPRCAAREDHNLRRAALADADSRMERILQAGHKAPAAQRGAGHADDLLHRPPVERKLQHQRLVIADDQLLGDRLRFPFFLAQEVFLLEPPRLELAIAAPGGAFLHHALQRLPIRREGDRAAQDHLVENAAAEVRIAKERVLLLVSVDDIGKVRRRGADIDDHRAFAHQRRINPQAPRMARIEERRARFRHDADVRKPRRFHQPGILLPPALAPARRTAHDRPRNLRHQRRLLAHQLRHHALRKGAHIASRARIGQEPGLEAHDRALRAGMHARLLAHDDLSVLIADSGKHARPAHQRQNARLDRRVSIQERHGALAVAQIKAQYLHALALLSIGQAAVPRRTSFPSFITAGRIVRASPIVGRISNMPACASL